MRYPAPNKFQVNIACKLGIDISRDSREVAAARLYDFLAPAFCKKRDLRNATPRQIEFAQELGFDVSADRLPIAHAKISQHLSVLNRHALRRLRLKPGDPVLVCDRDGQCVDQQTVSSVGRDGRVFFKGVGCRSAWASQLQRSR